MSIVKALSLIFIASLLMMFVSTSNSVFATHTTSGANYWYNVCKIPFVDAVIIEDCRGLVSNHDPYKQGLSTEGWRVAKCIAGGALLIYGGHPELLNLGPAVGCPSAGSSPSANNNLGNLLQGLSNLLKSK
jgi:hypothetical protein